MPEVQFGSVIENGGNMKPMRKMRKHSYRLSLMSLFAETCTKKFLFLFAEKFRTCHTNKPPKFPVKGNLQVHNSMNALASAVLSYDHNEGPKLNLVAESNWPMLAKESLKALAGLGLLSLGGKYLLRRVFELLFRCPRLGLTLQESVIIGFLLSQGGEFAFVAFSLANGLGVLPLELNKLLIIVVVLSMVLTPHCLTKLEDGPPILPMTSLMQRINSICNEHNLNISVSQKTEEMVSFEGSEPVAILEFGQMVQGPANFSSTPLASGGDGSFMGWPYVAFDLNPSVVKVSKSCTPASF
ncbi:hypothetical protein LWI28_021527 [Acer negundo]|uniref:Cation/H+ exchanger transmembrane domain-containing protein n=1 Tax=Acer negundo TaxID=4023 RepID=A0AAD5NG02_ACENE|nr:hypothetical protein LWI28_021527 [Acer negundo]